MSSIPLPLNGFACEYDLIDGGVYVSTTSWMNTFLVATGGAGLVAGSSLWFRGRRNIRRARRSDR